MNIELNAYTQTQRGEAHSSTTVNTARDQKTVTQAESGVSSHTDTVTMTEAAKLLSQVNQEIAQMPVINKERVAEVQNKIHADDYQPDYTKTATNIIRQESEFNEQSKP